MKEIERMKTHAKACEVAVCELERVPVHEVSYREGDGQEEHRGRFPGLARVVAEALAVVDVVEDVLVPKEQDQQQGVQHSGHVQDGHLQEKKRGEETNDVFRVQEEDLKRGNPPIESKEERKERKLLELQPDHPKAREEG